MKSLLFFTIALSLFASCSSKPKNPGVIEYARTFKAPYETVWRATQQALLNYPMNINNMDTGQLQTLYITGKHRYQAPHLEKTVLPSGYQYRLNINILRGKRSARVILAKEVRLQKNFFAEPQELTTDGFEEKALLYRIKREVLIEKLLKKKMESRKSQPSSKVNSPKVF